MLLFYFTLSISCVGFVYKGTLGAIYIIKNCANKSAVFPEQMTALLNESRTREPYADFMVLRHCDGNIQDKLLLCYNLASTLLPFPLFYHL